MDVMVDIETLGSCPEAAVVAIAAKTFEKDGEEFIRRISEPSGTIDSGTVWWWLRQDQEAIRRTFFGETLSERRAIAEVHGWLQDQGVKRLWAKSPSFDCVILSRLWARNGLVFPVPFWKWRDVRTAVEGHGYVEAEVPHDPMSDVIAQIESVKRARQKTT